MLTATIQSRGGVSGHYQAVIWNEIAQRRYSKVKQPIFRTDPCLSYERAKALAEDALGLLDWGKGDQPHNQASVAISGCGIGVEGVNPVI